jgi:hypothetical protein
MKKETILIRFLLNFCKWRYETSYTSMTQVRYKVLFGKKRCISVYAIPPQHFNCKCSFKGDD